MELSLGSDRIYGMDSPRPASALLPAFPVSAVEKMADAELEAGLHRLAWVERGALVLLLSHLAEFDRRRLYADHGQPSLFAYCTKVLGYSEQGAYKRIQAARAVRKHPLLLQRLASGELHLAAAVVLAPHLRPENAAELLAAARGKSTRELERFAAGLSPRPDAPDCLRALPGPARTAGPTAPLALSMPGGAPPVEPAVVDVPRPAPARGALKPDGPRESLEALSSDRCLFRFSGSERLRTKYHKARELLRLKVSGGTMESVFERGLDALLSRIDPASRHERRKAAKAPGPSGGPATRVIPRAIRDAVWTRDGGRCTFVGPDGLRCPATAWIEFDHVVPYALGGRGDDPANLRLCCRAHNQLLARRVFGDYSSRARTIHAESASASWRPSDTSATERRPGTRGP